MTEECVQLTKQQVVSLLVEIAELRAQVSDLTKSRDNYSKWYNEGLREINELKDELDKKVRVEE